MVTEENPYLYRESAAYNSDSHIREINRLWCLAEIGSLVRIQLNGPGNEYSMEWESRPHIGEVGVITKKYSIVVSNFLTSVLLGNGILLEKVHVLDFVVIQPANSNDYDSGSEQQQQKKNKKRSVKKK